MGLYRILIGLIVALVTFNVGAAAAAEAGPVARGEYLARIGNCAGCHTAPGGADFAGGLRLASPYGTFITPNITPDHATGIGDWNADDFWHALHDGQRADGRPLYPACPYPSYTHVRRADVDAIYAYLRSLPAVARDNPAHDLAFPYRYRALVNIWQALYFEPGSLTQAPEHDAAWQRGRYLVEGLGHCNECHRARRAFGALRKDADAPGAIIHGWYAPALADPAQAGLQRWPVDAAAHFLRAGVSADAAMMGPMADVVFDSLQYLRGDDAQAMATYLTSLPPSKADSPVRLLQLTDAARRSAMTQGQDLYAGHCADCHGDLGRGGDGAPALAGNRAVTMTDPLNTANMIREGGFAAATQGNPRPHGMPPFYQLSDGELAAVISYIRGSWGNDAAAVSPRNLGR